MKDGLIKIAAAVPELRLADTVFNGEAILARIAEAEQQGVKVLALPALCLTGATCGDLFFQSTLLRGAEQALVRLLEQTAEKDLLIALGLPLAFAGRLYSCAAVCARGRLLGLVPKGVLRADEQRWFSAWTGERQSISFSGQACRIGRDLLFSCESLPNLCVGVDFDTELFAPDSPSVRLAQGGASIILNLSAENEQVTRPAFRRMLLKTQSARLCCGYVAAGAGEGESTTDQVFSGHCLLAENGKILNESRLRSGLCISEIDLSFLDYERRTRGFPMSSQEAMCKISFLLQITETTLSRPISPSPFVPQHPEERRERCEEILQLAALGLKQRMVHTGARSLVIGLSGGLDSTLALLIALRTTAMLELPPTTIQTVSMPCFGTTSRTRSNAEKLAEELHVSFRTIDISEAVRRHFADLGHEESQRTVVYENAQARERTQLLMDLANGMDALVVGTGDLSELALGWATYNGDHMSMYGVNGGIPKTLVRHLVQHSADRAETESLAAVLRDILETPVSPELLPAENGNISQKTEELVGPYALHDFFLYHIIRRGSPPETVLRLAIYAFAESYDPETIKAWLKTFLLRFFTQQYKRSCLPDGPQVGSLSLSPRGGLKMPSDAAGRLWLAALEEL